MRDSRSGDKQRPTFSVFFGRWRFAVIIIANIWLVYVIMRWGTVPAPLPDSEGPAAGYSPVTTLIASAALVGAVLALVVGISQLYRSLRGRRSPLAIYRGTQTPPDQTGSGRGASE
jgi:hypothetical protein